MDHDVIVVGGGIAGLTAAAYLARAGYGTLLCEKEHTLGGLVRTFERRGFCYDGGIRAIENSGVVFPMLRQLGLDVPFVRSQVSVGIEDRVIRLESQESLAQYQALLVEFFPDDRDAISAIIAGMRRAMGYMDVLYGIDNPLFVDFSRDLTYLLKVLFPWLFRYSLTMPRIAALNEPIVNHLRRFTRNESLIDVIAQHFFRATPASFALSYFRLYLDYSYPLGGTGKLVEALARYVVEHGGELATNTEVVAIDPERRRVTDSQGRTYGYRGLIWAADLKTLYRRVNPDAIKHADVRQAVVERGTALADKTGGDSVLTLYLALDLDKSYVADRASEHFFYTSSRVGQSTAGPLPLGEGRRAIETWLRSYLGMTTFEISCPVLRDSSLAPPGKTGLIVSVLFDYALAKQVEAQGWYEEFKAYCEECILHTLDATVFPGIREAVLDRFSSTPLSIAKATGNADGAITGWAFTNDTIPAECRMSRIASATGTPIPGILQAGQWTFSPSGLPISVLTGKLAADRMGKWLKGVVRSDRRINRPTRKQ